MVKHLLFDAHVLVHCLNTHVLVLFQAHSHIFSCLWYMDGTNVDMMDVLLLTSWFMVKHLLQAHVTYLLVYGICSRLGFLLFILFKHLRPIFFQASSTYLYLTFMV
jgi:hypothetical protein